MDPGQYFAYGYNSSSTIYQKKCTLQIIFENQLTLCV